ncbi:peptidoglycan/xylan/chitin deacetylase (PgdA/CDA1 family) [Anaerosolibacter carboniphilus]|uniref:Peptidoglycan/xylan/chitin deacetylase (PgdA/CDA1 family) n=1 Tax=Anaerosolibacter carboniphilus TaxID=1417629 RepID=A0A841KYN8_9FIRM|nr:polysaccharide deacetylase family protein [Anaerosolibacter carboniphilus]MBB6217080.1 peptidoglycan/xylan/chitin deacetylase (PgdA/CDA1 family) [Anaerosolibacter carboniphilus]
MTRNKKIIALAVASMILTAGCNSLASQNSVPVTENSGVTMEKNQEGEKEAEAAPAVKKEIDLQMVKPNEAGQIMVLMYHNISEPEAEWTRTPDNLRKDLQILYDKGYRPISLRDYVTGNITIEAGYTPVVLTFDDGWQNNFNLIQDSKGEWIVDSNSAVGILEKFHTEHPDFPLEATFFVNDNIPFGQKEHLTFKLKYIVEKGMDVGNHTVTHVDFTKADPERMQKELAGIVEMIGKHLPDYEVNTLALPFGSRPKDKSLYTYLEQGIHEGTSYKNIAILNVGWDPDKSPYHKDFNPLAIHRIRGSELEKYVQNVGMYNWLEQFDKGSRTRFVSDGDPDTVTVPENFKEALDSAKIGNREVKTYILEK